MARIRWAEVGVDGHGWGGRCCGEEDLQTEGREVEGEFASEYGGCEGEDGDGEGKLCGGRFAGAWGWVEEDRVRWVEREKVQGRTQEEGEHVWHGTAHPAWEVELRTVAFAFVKWSSLLAAQQLSSIPETTTTGTTTTTTGTTTTTTGTTTTTTTEPELPRASDQNVAREPSLLEPWPELSPGSYESVSGDRDWRDILELNSFFITEY
ncbi:hypothetical protein DFP72DRAFT_843847 [Ephemerocybe angulata]|uniref:Uncharacterized protein n=1 Tax=Ephemerocybe angulata TaxID=980116 RepID=A0A8H6I6B0_9AGAR|nr:hypothetical protein DFP72DRAFT_843847 [Tulosesus angulatus]